MIGLNIIKPTINPTFFYGEIVGYQFTGEVSKDRNTYRIRFSLFFKSGDVYKTQKGGYKTKADAIKAKEILIADLVRNDYIPFNYTLEEFCNFWLYHHMLKENKIAYNTYYSYYNILYNYLIPNIGGNKQLMSITSEDLIDVYRQIKYESIKGYYLKTVKNLFSFAVSNHYIRYNPSLVTYEILKSNVKSSHKRDVPHFSVEHVRFLLYTCKENFPDMYIPVLLSLCIGTRISETLALKYSDIDFNHERIYVSKQIGRSLTIADTEIRKTTAILDPKTQNGIRCIPVSRWVLDELLIQKVNYENNKKNIRNFNDTDLICCHIDGRPYHRKAFQKSFHELLKMCGLPDIHWHDMRHIYASLLKNNKVNMKAISEFLGHHSPEFTDAVYTYCEEIAYDCTVLQEIWQAFEICRTINEQKRANFVLDIPLSGNEI